MIHEYRIKKAHKIINKNFVHSTIYYRVTGHYSKHFSMWQRIWIQYYGGHTKF